MVTVDDIDWQMVTVRVWKENDIVPTILKPVRVTDKTVWVHFEGHRYMIPKEDVIDNKYGEYHHQTHNIDFRIDWRKHVHHWVRY